MILGKWQVSFRHVNETPVSFWRNETESPRAQRRYESTLAAALGFSLARRGHKHSKARARTKAVQAEATALQAPARWPSAVEPRGAPGVQRVHRRCSPARHTHGPSTSPARAIVGWHLTRKFHTPARRVRARGLQHVTLSLVGRVPSPGALMSIQAQCEKFGLGARPVSRAHYAHLRLRCHTFTHRKAMVVGTAFAVSQPGLGAAEECCSPPAGKILIFFDLVLRIVGWRMNDLFP